MQLQDYSDTDRYKRRDHHPDIHRLEWEWEWEREWE
jgi:hypothetical protein